MSVRFPLGQTVATPGAMSALEDSGQSPVEFLSRHVSGDWGDLCDEDAGANEEAVKNELRVFSVYHTSQKVKLYVITEADRSSTCILKPEEY